ncbi:MAG: cytochrome c-type biogenesis protein CcmH [Acidobacteria bacterium]|nr:cytochrome c-type biogenesis protein CcmH [Acidobacteriota bacterium]
MSGRAPATSVRHRLGTFRVWLVALVAVVALALVTSPTASGPAQRVAHLENLVKCPSCQDLSVAQSTSSSALAVRHQIVALVARGESDTQILTTIEAAYGTSVLLSPSTSGVGTLLWLLPTAVFVGLATTVLVLRRRR